MIFFFLKQVEGILRHMQTVAKLLGGWHSGHLSGGREAEAGGAGVGCQPGLHNETESQKVKSQ